MFADNRVKNKGSDFEGRITNAVIDNFYKLSAEAFGMASSLHRDSNAYSDLMANDAQEYPQLLEEGDLKNIKANNQPVFNEQQLENLKPQQNELKYFYPSFLSSSGHRKNRTHAPTGICLEK